MELLIGLVIGYCLAKTEGKETYHYGGYQPTEDIDVTNPPQ